MTPSVTTLSSPACPLTSRLDAYFDHELPEAERAQIESHLPTCPACRQAVDQIAATSSLVKSIELPALSQIGRARVIRELTESAAARDRWLLPIRLLTAAAAAVFLLAAGLIAYQVHHTNSAPGAPGIVQPIMGHQPSAGSARILPTGTTHP
jgi:anti-sigma factor RsiW